MLAAVSLGVVYTRRLLEGLSGAFRGAHRGGRLGRKLALTRPGGPLPVALGVSGALVLISVGVFLSVRALSFKELSAGFSRDEPRGAMFRGTAERVCRLTPWVSVLGERRARITLAYLLHEWCSVRRRAVERRSSRARVELAARRLRAGRCNDA